FGPDIQRSSTRQRIKPDSSEVEQHLEWRLGQLVGVERPVEFDPVVRRTQRFQQGARLVGLHVLAVSARRAEGETEKLELGGAGLGTAFEQFYALLAHLRIFLAAQQFKPVIERSHRAEHVMAKA